MSEEQTKKKHGVIFFNKNNPGAFYFGDMRHEAGLAIEGGDPQRLFGDKAKGAKPGDTIDVATSDGRQSWEVLEAPESWEKACEKESLSDEDGEYICTLAAWGFHPGCCMTGALDADGIKYPYMRWGGVHVHSDDPELIYMIPLIECDPYGRITDDIYEGDVKNGLSGVGILIEDSEGQDHQLAFVGDGAWVHLTDLVGMEWGGLRNRIVDPCLKALSNMIVRDWEDTENLPQQDKDGPQYIGDWEN